MLHLLHPNEDFTFKYAVGEIRLTTGFPTRFCTLTVWADCENLLKDTGSPHSRRCKAKALDAICIAACCCSVCASSATASPFQQRLQLLLPELGLILNPSHLGLEAKSLWGESVGGTDRGSDH